VGVALVVLALGVGFASGSTVTPAQTGCSYGQCPQTFALSTIEIVLILLAIIAVALAVLWLRGRRRRAAAGAEPVTPWQAGPPPGEGGAAADELAAGAVGAGAAGAAVAASYVEGPEDQSVPQPGMPTAPGAAGAAAGEEPDIDSLMQELDKISGEILQRNAPKKDAPATQPPAEGEGSDGGGASE
jgi:type IV secretory pathway TrbL component